MTSKNLIAMKKLTPKQEKFANLYVELGNASEAYRQAYDVSEDTISQVVWNESSKLLKKDNINLFIKSLREGGEIEFNPIKKPTKGYVYLLHLEGFDFYKIGISQDVPSRKRKLQTLVPFEIKTIKTIHIESYRDVEKKIHESLEEYRHRGEWFKGCLGLIIKEFNKYDRQARTIL